MKVLSDRTAAALVAHLRAARTTMTRHIRHHGDSRGAPVLFDVRYVGSLPVVENDSEPDPEPDPTVSLKVAVFLPYIANSADTRRAVYFAGFPVRKDSSVSSQWRGWHEIGTFTYDRSTGSGSDSVSVRVLNKGDSDLPIYYWTVVLDSLNPNALEHEVGRLTIATLRPPQEGRRQFGQWARIYTRTGVQQLRHGSLSIWPDEDRRPVVVEEVVTDVEVRRGNKLAFTLEKRRFENGLRVNLLESDDPSYRTLEFSFRYDKNAEEIVISQQ